MDEQLRNRIIESIESAKPEALLNLTNALSSAGDIELIELAEILKKDERIIRLLNKN